MLRYRRIRLVRISPALQLTSDIIMKDIAGFDLGDLKHLYRHGFTIFLLNDNCLLIMFYYSCTLYKLIPHLIQYK